jgi:phosphoserine phosphatase
MLRLAILDVDGTLKQAESPYQYLHDRLGVAHLAASHKDLALSGQISYGEWLQRDAALWIGQRADYLQQMLGENSYVPGAPELLRALKRAGVVVALVSAGFTLNTDPIVAEFGLDYALANELKVVDGVLNGDTVNHVPEGGKAAFAAELMKRLDVSPDVTLAAGDTRGDLELFRWAGVRLAVNPRSAILRAQADAVFEPDLTGAVAWLMERGYLPGEAIDRSSAEIELGPD